MFSEIDQHGSFFGYFFPEFYFEFENLMNFSEDMLAMLIVLQSIGVLFLIRI